MTRCAMKSDHLGAMLMDDYFLPRNLSIYRVAKDTGIPRRILTGALTGRDRLPVREAVLLARYFGEEDGLFAQRQLEFDLRNMKRQQEQASH